MRGSVWVIYKNTLSIGIAATEIDAIRYLVDVEWIKMDEKEIEYWDDKEHTFLTPREAAKQANMTVEEILEEVLEVNQSPYFSRYGLLIREERTICGYDIPVE